MLRAGLTFLLILACNSGLPAVSGHLPFFYVFRFQFGMTVAIEHMSGSAEFRLKECHG